MSDKTEYYSKYLAPVVDSSEMNGFSVFIRNEWSTYFGPQWEAPFKKFPRGMYGRSGRLIDIGLLIVQGYTVREIKRRTGAHSVTIKKLYDKIEEITGRKILCKCGSHARHRGWCWYRYQNSKARQAVVKRWHRKSDNQIQFIIRTD